MEPSKTKTTAHGYKFQVSFDKVFIEGPLKGKRYPDYLRFTTRNDAEHFAARDGSLISPFCGTGTYRQEYSQVAELPD